MSAWLPPLLLEAAAGLMMHCYTVQYVVRVVASSIHCCVCVCMCTVYVLYSYWNIFLKKRYTVYNPIFPELDFKFHRIGFKNDPNFYLNYALTCLFYEGKYINF